MSRNIHCLDIEALRDLRPKVKAGKPRLLGPWQHDELMGQAETIGERTLVTLLYNTGLRINELRLLSMFCYNRAHRGKDFEQILSNESP